MNSLDLNSTEKLRDRVVLGMSATMFFVAIYLSYAVFTTGKYLLLASFELGYAIFSGFIFWKCIKRKLTQNKKIIYIYSLITLIIYAVYLGKLQGFILGWVLFIPTLSYLLLGNKFGFSTSLISFLLTILTFSLQVTLPASYVWSNFILCFLCIWVVSHFYESARSASEKAMRSLAMKDNLTQCNNRLALNHHYEKYRLRDSISNFHLLLLDIDYFKLVNDTYGHEAGDLVLQKVAHEITILLDDNHLYRIGGEEFCIMISQDSKFKAIEFAESVRVTIENLQIQFNNQYIPTTVSIGIEKIQTNSQLSETLRHADIALYQAKRDGRNNVKYYTD
ncbi:hypothetical protein SOPP22_04705 [Shewanella sp. OPT22]|nr:hypothetical protein SOPP22_04705 [Shewanella sp. OPT22]